MRDYDITEYRIVKKKRGQASLFFWVFGTDNLGFLRIIISQQARGRMLYHISAFSLIAIVYDTIQVAVL